MLGAFSSLMGPAPGGSTRHPRPPYRPAANQGWKSALVEDCTRTRRGGNSQAASDRLGSICEKTSQSPFAGFHVGARPTRHPAGPGEGSPPCSHGTRQNVSHAPRDWQSQDRSPRQQAKPRRERSESIPAPLGPCRSKPTSRRLLQNLKWFPSNCGLTFESKIETQNHLPAI